MLIIRPAVNFEEGERYIVALRNLKNAAASDRAPGARELPPLPRPHHDRAIPPIERRRAHFESHLPTTLALGRASAARHLYLAWDFTVASARSLAGRMLHIRDDAFAGLGDRNLRDLEVAGQRARRSRSTPSPICTPGQDDRIARRVEGTLTVPCYLDQRLRAGRPASASTARAAPMQQGHDDRQVHLPHPAVGARPGLAAAGAAVALRARAAGQPQRGQRRQRALDGQRAPLRLLRDRLGRLLERGHRQRRLGDRGPLELQHGRRPDAAGLPEPAAASAGR